MKIISIPASQVKIGDVITHVENGTDKKSKAEYTVIDIYKIKGRVLVFQCVIVEESWVEFVVSEIGEKIDVIKK